MAGPRQPIDLVAFKGKTHLTKAEIEARKAGEVRAPANNVAPPGYLSDKEKAKFEEVAGVLLQIGIMSDLDCDALARYLQSESKYLKYTTLLNGALRRSKVDSLYDDIVLIEKLEGLRDKALKQCRAAASDLGLTISSRCKLVMPTKTTKNDPHAGMFGDGEGDTG